MILLRCEACGGNQLKKQGNLYECAFCGSKYILDTNETIINKSLTEDDIISKLGYANQLHQGVSTLYLFYTFNFYSFIFNYFF